VTTQFWRAALNTGDRHGLRDGDLSHLRHARGYALARSTYRYRFYILVAALFFRAMPEVTLVSGYLYPFFALNIWGYCRPRSRCSWRSTSPSRSG
jgi:multiple sugar transport system permease protein